jgi:hypothetical protein
MNIHKFLKRDETKNKKKYCIQCGIEIPAGSSRFKVRKFCSRRCNRKYFSLKRYYKIKDEAWYKVYRREYFKRWVNKNRKKFNENMREISLRHQKKKKNEKESLRETFKNINVLDKKGEIDSIHDTIPIRG